jgi:hypothetical protein
VWEVPPGDAVSPRAKINGIELLSPSYSVSRNDENIRDRRETIPCNHLSDGGKTSGQESGEESGSEEADHRLVVASTRLAVIQSDLEHTF